ncbi:hypothetical protein AAE478_002139 [Parahypoxylon ruwenzoriense]
MEDLRVFYRSYSNSYDGLILKVERRKKLEEKVLGIRKKPKDNADKIIKSDRKGQEPFHMKLLT